MNRSTLYSARLGIVSAVFCCSQFAGAAHASSAVDPDASASADAVAAIDVQRALAPSRTAAIILPDYQLVFSDDQNGGAYYDLSEFAGQSNISPEEMLVGHPIIHFDSSAETEGC